MTITTGLTSLAADSFVIGHNKLISQFSPNKVFGIPRVNELIKASDSVHFESAGPWGVEIHLTSCCQLSCNDCSYRHRNKGVSFLSSETVSSLLDQLNSLKIKSLIFSGGGDPLAWHGGKFEELLRDKVKYKRAIATNGIGLDKLSKRALSLLDIIQVHVCGYDDSSFIRTANISLFRKLNSNLDWLFANRDKRKTQVSAKVLLDRKNYKEIPGFLKYCKSKKFDIIIVKLAGNFEERQNCELSENQKMYVRKLILSTISDWGTNWIDGINTKNNLVNVTLPSECWLIKLGLYMLIRSTGDVFPCVASPFTAENSIGNIYKSTLSSIWTSHYHYRTIAKLNNDMRSNLCKLGVCRGLRYNCLIQQKINTSGSFAKKNTLKEPLLI